MRLANERHSKNFGLIGMFCATSVGQRGNALLSIALIHQNWVEEVQSEFVINDLFLPAQTPGCLSSANDVMTGHWNEAYVNLQTC